MTDDTGLAGQIAAADRLAADRLLLQTGRRAGGWVVGLMIASLLLALAHTVLPAVLGRVLDTALAGTDFGRWLLICGLLLAILVACDVLDDLAAGMSTARSTGWLRRTVLNHILALGIRATRRFDSGDLTARLVGNAADAGRIGTVAIWAVTAFLPAVGGVVALALIDPWLCLTFLVGAPALVTVARRCMRDASASAEQYLRVQAGIVGRLAAALAGARTIAAARTTEWERRRVLSPLPELRRHGMDMWRVQTTIAAQEALLVPLLQVAVLAVAGWELARGRISPGELLAASQYVGLAAGLGSAAMSVTQLAQARAAAARNATLLAEEPMRYGQERRPGGPGRLEFRGVTVRAGDTTAGDTTLLHDIDLVIPAGSLVAVVGRSGSGKSLLAGLAGRLVDPDEGAVLLDGVALPRLARVELRRAVCCAFERPTLLGDTLADVIAFGVTRPHPDEIVAAARAASADGFIRRMPAGYETPLAEAPMSGGEVQRLGLARAFAHAGSVLVLDDVAASLDTVTEHRIREVLTGALADRTRLIVAHRVSTAAQSDLVVWLDEGRVRAVAPHPRLWTEPSYRALFDAAVVPEGRVAGGALQ